MSYALTYSEIITQLQKYCIRVNDTVNFIPQLPIFIKWAEIRCARDSKLLLAKLFVQGELNIGNPTLQKPANWRETVSISIGTGTGFNNVVFLKPRGYEFCRQYWPNTTETGQPEYYADSDYNFFYFVGIPDAEYPVEIVYFGQPEFLSETNQTNRLTEIAPDMLFAACMVEAYRFLKNNDEQQKWEQVYMEKMSSIVTEDGSRQVDATQQRGKGA